MKLMDYELDTDAWWPWSAMTVKARMQMTYGLLLDRPMSVSFASHDLTHVAQMVSFGAQPKVAQLGWFYHLILSLN